MRWVFVERLAWGVAVGFTVIGLIALHLASEAWREMPGGAQPVQLGPPDPLDSVTVASATILASHPFRLSRRPAERRYGELPPEEPPAEPAAVPSLDLRLVGVAGGPPWRAVVEGFPGPVGRRMVQPGEVIDAVRILAVRRDTVVVSFGDSTLVLTLRRP